MATAARRAEDAPGLQQVVLGTLLAGVAGFAAFTTTCAGR